MNDKKDPIGYVFRDPHLFHLAMSHRSYSLQHNERLEFLGDAMLDAVLTHYLYIHFPDQPEGVLSRWRAHLVQRNALVELSQQLCLAEKVYRSSSVVKVEDSIVANAVEALIGAIFVDGGYLAIEKCVLSWYADKLKISYLQDIDKDAKSKLQEYAQKKKWALPSYRHNVVRSESHAPTYRAACRLDHPELESYGMGKNIRAAEQKAANNLLAILAQQNDANTK